jgi:O86/O127-antigen biosynthesis alpha-1,3-N-acetylgalactosaminyltransferase
MAKIILTPGNSEMGGVGTFVLQLVEAIGRHEMLLLTGATVRPRCYRGVRCVNVEGFDRVPGWRAFVSIVKFCRHVPAELIVANGTGGLLVGAVCKLLMGKRLRVINVFHGLTSRYERWGRAIRMLEKGVAYIADDNVFLTYVDKSRLTARGVVIPNAVPRGSAATRLSADSEEMSSEFKGMTVVARHSRQKNIRLVLDVATRVRDFPIRIFGGGEEIDAAESRARDSALGHVRLRPWALSNEIYKCGTVFVLPTFAEGFPFSILEAASVGLPLVVSDLPELREICGDLAQYFSNDSPDGLESIYRSLVKPTEYRKWSEKAFVLADRYSYEAWRDRWRELLDRCST